ncbi:hypothetical protein B0H13DRAFT_1910404 [Mycena leptocephala]|nr:hypothetical protein B0H13DRAFT_1910404 [Mycena leptocephala]
MHFSSTIAVLTSLASFTFGRPTRNQTLGTKELSQRYVGGWCGCTLHRCMQKQPDEAGVFTVTLKDAVGNVIGGVSNVIVVGNGNGFGVDSQLPFVWELHFINEPQDLRFNYAAEVWTTSSSQCSVGGWTGDVNNPGPNLQRDMDCGFSC